MNKVVINTCYGGFDLSEEALKFLQKRGHEVVFESWGCYLVNDIERHNKDLIECVETLGEQAASGSCARLFIQEISGDIYSIEEYDGVESIKTPDTYHWINIKN